MAITPQLPEFTDKMMEETELKFDLLTDEGNEYAAELGLRFALPEPLKALYDSFGLNLPKNNGDDSWTLPMPGRFVVDSAGIVRYASVDPDYTYRPEPEESLKVLQALN